MFIQQKALLLFLAFLFIGSGLSMANNPIKIDLHQNASIDEGRECDEPAPINFRVAALGPDNALLKWDPPASNPFRWQIEVFKIGNVLPDQTILVPGGTYQVQINNLQPGIAYRVVNTPMCEDGKLSVNFASVEFDVIITDLVVCGFTPSEGGSNEIIDQPGDVIILDSPFDNLVSLKLINIIEFPEINFGVIRRSSDEISTIIKGEFAAPNIAFNCGLSNQPYCVGNFFTILSGNTKLAQFSYAVTSENEYQFRLIEIAPKFAVKRMSSSTGEPKPSCVGPNHGGHRDAEKRNNASGLLSAQPNPFGDQLMVQIPFANITKSTKINLYDLQGSGVMDVQVAGDQQTINLSTQNLLPGMYFLRAESGDVVQTIKVVKTQ